MSRFREILGSSRKNETVENFMGGESYRVNPLDTLKMITASSIFGQISMGHMALIRNLRGVFAEVEDREFCREYLERLKGGVESGGQFPFRYYSAWQAVKKSTCAHQPQILDALEECMDLSMENLPRFQGKTMCLSDNSGSAWGMIPSEYGSVQVAVIDNLSSVIAAAASEEGYVGNSATG